MTISPFVCDLGVMSKDPDARVAPALRTAFARRLAAARAAAGYETMREFARALGIEEARYRRWENAETEPDLTHLDKIARLTGAELDTLISGKRRQPEAA
jgi:transcriptional regulator with XRE-family HTH domain